MTHDIHIHTLHTVYSVYRVYGRAGELSFIYMWEPLKARQVFMCAVVYTLRCMRVCERKYITFSNFSEKAKDEISVFIAHSWSLVIVVNGCVPIYIPRSQCDFLVLPSSDAFICLRMRLIAEKRRDWYTTACVFTKVFGLEYNIWERILQSFTCVCMVCVSFKNLIRLYLSAFVFL